MTMLALIEVTCERCGNKWVPRVPQPKRCPSCKSPYWAVKRRRGATTGGLTNVG